VDIPQVGTLYRFTSPRGEATISVRAFSQSSIATLERLGVALAIVVVLWLAFRFASRPAGTRVSRSTVRWVAIAIGVIGLVTGVLPILAVVLLILGIAMCLLQWTNRASKASMAA